MADNLSPYYSAGTATLTNGSAAVTGQSSLWLSGQLRAGDRIESDAGEVATVLTIDSDTAITLDKPFKGTSQTAAPYKIWRTTDAQFLMESARKAYSLLGAGGIQALAGLTGSANKFPMFSGPNTMTLLSRQDITNGVKFDARVDTLAHRSAYDASAADFSVLVSDIGDGRAAIYTKNTATVGDWSGPAYITGPVATVEVGTTTTGDYGSDAEVVPTPIAGGVSLAFTIPGSPSIEVGSTTTLAPGSAATVEPTPVTGGVSLAFGIPAGKGFAFGGVYDNATAYVLGDVVRDNGSSWIALQPTTGNAPPVYPVTSNAYWELLAVKGLDGTGTGDVVGPPSATADNLAVFDGTTGKLVKDGGKTVAEVTASRITPQGRLSLVSNTPISASDVVGATTIYYVPAAGNRIPIYDGATFREFAMSGQISHVLDSDTSHTNYQADYENYDEFVFLDGATLRLGNGPRWQEGVVAGSDNGRGSGAGSTELEALNGLLVNKNQVTIRFGNGAGDTVVVPARCATYVGTFIPIGNGLATDRARQRMLFNAYNQTLRSIYSTEDITVSWTYSVSAWRDSNNAGYTRIEFVLGLTGGMVEASATSFAMNSTTTARAVEAAIGLDALTPAVQSLTARTWVVSGQPTMIHARYAGSPSEGRHSLLWLEKGAGADTQTWFGSSPTEYRVGMVGSVLS